jgi:flagellar basal body-associated protein FliL
MSVVIGGRTTSARESRWIMLAILLIILIANHAFGTVTMPKKQQPERHVTEQQRSAKVCRVDAQKVPRCVVLGTFPTNAAWQQILKGGK